MTDRETSLPSRSALYAKRISIKTGADPQALDVLFLIDLIERMRPVVEAAEEFHAKVNPTHDHYEEMSDCDECHLLLTVDAYHGVDHV